MSEPSKPPEVDPHVVQSDEAVPVPATEAADGVAGSADVDAAADVPEPVVAEVEALHQPPEASITESAAEGEKGVSLGRNVLEWITILGGALVVALVVTRFLVQAFFIPSLSMFPTLDQGDRVLVNKLSYRLHDLRRGDLIVFERPSDDGVGQVKDLIKRVVALEGEKIEARAGMVLIDGKPLDEPYLGADVRTTNLEPLVVPPGHVFVMGDNRSDSRDSRFFGPLREEQVIGRAFVKIWPLDDLETL